MLSRQKLAMMSPNNHREPIIKVSESIRVKPISLRISKPVEVVRINIVMMHLVVGPTSCLKLISPFKFTDPWWLVDIG